VTTSSLKRRKEEEYNCLLCRFPALHQKEKKKRSRGRKEDGRRPFLRRSFQKGTRTGGRSAPAIRFTSTARGFALDFNLPKKREKERKKGRGNCAVDETGKKKRRRASAQHLNPFDVARGATPKNTTSTPPSKKKEKGEDPSH